MGQLAVSRPAPRARLRDFLELGKPRLSALVLFTAATGLAMAPEAPAFVPSALFVGATFLLVVAANTLNCWIEREIDGLMFRTRSRPLPAGRLEPRTALVSGILLAAFSLGLLALTTNPVTTALGVVALVSYVAVYTPLKRVTPWAVLVGAVPGALPPLMGWTAATGELALGGWYLFGILFFWQLPHFVAITVYLKDDFVRAGLPVMSVAYGPAVVRAQIFVFTVLLAVWTLAAQPLGLAGIGYTVTASVLSLVFLLLAAAGVRRGSGEREARRVFAWSLLYLPVLIVVLVLA